MRVIHRTLAQTLTQGLLTLPHCQQEHPITGWASTQPTLSDMSCSNCLLITLTRRYVDKLSSCYVNPRYKRDGNSYIIISCLIQISTFGEEPLLVLPSSSLCNCTKLGDENSDAWTRLTMALWRQLISESLNSQKLKFSLENQGRSQKVLRIRIGWIGLYFDGHKSRPYQML